MCIDKRLARHQNDFLNSFLVFKNRFFSLKINNVIFIERNVIEFFNFVNFGLMQLSEEIRYSVMCLSVKMQEFIQYIFIIIVTKSCNIEGNSEYFLFLKRSLHSLFF